MSKQEHKTEVLDHKPDSASNKPEGLGKEAAAGMHNLVQDRQKLIAFLKDGGQSGITNDFGKPLILDKTGQPEAKLSPYDVSKYLPLSKDAIPESPETVGHQYTWRPAEGKVGDWEVKPHKETSLKQELINGQERLAEVHFPSQKDGQPAESRVMDYDKAGNLTKVKEPDGSSFEQVKGSDGTSHWVHRYPPGVRALDPADYNVSVDQSGTVKIENKSTGTTQLEYKDGHDVYLDRKGRVTAVDYLNKSAEDQKSGGDGNRHFRYDEKGEINQYTAPNGSRWASKDGEHWQKIDKDGNPIPGEKNSIEGKLAIQPDGAFTFENHREPKHTTTVTPDGHRDNHYESSGETAIADARGHHKLSKQELAEEHKKLQEDVDALAEVRNRPEALKKLKEDLKELHDKDPQAFNMLVRKLEHDNPNLIHTEGEGNVTKVSTTGGATYEGLEVWSGDKGTPAQAKQQQSDSAPSPQDRSQAAGSDASGMTHADASLDARNKSGKHEQSTEELKNELERSYFFWHSGQGTVDAVMKDLSKLHDKDPKEFDKEARKLANEHPEEFKVEPPSPPAAPDAPVKRVHGPVGINPDQTLWSATTGERSAATDKTAQLPDKLAAHNEPEHISQTADSRALPPNHKSDAASCKREGEKLREMQKLDRQDGGHRAADEEKRLQQLVREGKLTQDDVNSAHYWRDHKLGTEDQRKRAQAFKEYGVDEEGVRQELEREVVNGDITPQDAAAILDDFNHT